MKSNVCEFAFYSPPYMEEDSIGRYYCKKDKIKCSNNGSECRYFKDFYTAMLQQNNLFIRRITDGAQEYEIIPKGLS